LKRAVALAKKHDKQLHVMHISTGRELELLTTESLENKKITAEVTPAHLTFCDKDYERLGTRIKCNPAIKSEKDRDALREGLRNGKIDIVGTDHAPHLIEDKKGGALKATSGMPSLQFSLLAMLRMVDDGIFTIEQIVEKMCHAPADLFKVDKRGYIRKGYYADLVLVAPGNPHTITAEDVLSLCGWSPFEGEQFDWKVMRTWVNGECVYSDGVVNDKVRGKALKFNR
jgi:dihydroorotase